MTRAFYPVAHEDKLPPVWLQQLFNFFSIFFSVSSPWFLHLTFFMSFYIKFNPYFLFLATIIICFNKILCSINHKIIFKIMNT